MIFAGMFSNGGWQAAAKRGGRGLPERFLFCFVLEKKNNFLFQRKCEKSLSVRESIPGLWPVSKRKRLKSDSEKHSGSMSACMEEGFLGRVNSLSH